MSRRAATADQCSCVEVCGEDPSCVFHGIGTDWWAEEIHHNPLARAELVETLRRHDRRVSELLAANTLEVERRRTVEDTLRQLLIAVEQVEYIGLDEDLYQAALSGARAALHHA